MLDRRLQGIVAALNHALSRGDLGQAARYLERLRASFADAGPRELPILRDALAQWLQQATELRGAYARDLKALMRQRQNATAYQDMASPQRR